MNSLKIVVTGASGFIGSQVSRHLALNLPGSLITGIGRKESSNINSKLSNYEYQQCNLLEKNSYAELPGEIDILIHLAGDRRTFVASADYTRQTIDNVLMTSYISDYAQSAGARLIMYASSVYIYSGISTLPFQEKMLTLPADNLGAGKLASEALLKARAMAGFFKAVAFRIGTVFGPGASEGQFIPQAIMKLNSEGHIVRFGAGDIKRDFIYIEDVAEAFMAGASLHDSNIDFESYNVGSGISTSIREVVMIMTEILGNDKEVEFSATGKGKADIDHQLDITRIKADLGWQPSISLKEGLKKTIDHIVS